MDADRCEHPVAMRRGAARGARIVELGLLLVVAVAVGGIDYLPTHDGPQHIFTGHVANHLDSPGTGWSTWLEPNVRITSHGFGLLFGPLDAVFSWKLATRISLTLLALAWTLGAYLFVGAVHSERRWLGVALGAGAFQWTLYMGMFSFYAATAFSLFVLALAFRPQFERRAQSWILSGLLLLTALMHVVPAALCGLVIATLLLFRARSGQRLAEYGRIALVALPALCVLMATLSVHWLASSTASTAAQSPSYLASSAPWWSLGRCFLSGPDWRAWPLALLAVFALGLGIRCWNSARAEDRALCVAGGSLLLAGVALPLHLPAWEYFSVRFLPLATCVLVSSLPLERLAGSRLRRAVALGCALFALLATGWAHRYNRELVADTREALAGLEADIKRDGWRLPLVLDPLAGRPFANEDAPIPYAAPLLNLAKLYAVVQGGIPTYAFVADPAIHELLIREALRDRVPTSPDPRLMSDLANPLYLDRTEIREAVMALSAAHAAGLGFQDVILWGRPEDVELMQRFGFRSDWHRGGLALMHFEGCPLDLRFPAAAGLDASDVVELGWLPAKDVTHRYSLSDARREVDGSLTLPMLQGCGSLWVRFEGNTHICEGADAEGRLLISWRREGRSVECRVAPEVLAGQQSDHEVRR